LGFLGSFMYKLISLETYAPLPNKCMEKIYCSSIVGSGIIIVTFFPLLLFSKGMLVWFGFAFKQCTIVIKTA